MKAIVSIIFALFFLQSSAKREERNYTCINEKGETLFSIKAWRMYDYNDGLAKFETVAVENGQAFWRYGFIDDKGKIVIPAVYEKAGDFSSGVTWVKSPGADNFHMIDKSNKRISAKTYKKVGHIIEGMSAVYENDRMGFVDSTGKEVIPCKYTGSPAFSEGLVCLCPYDATAEAYGYLDKKGETVIPFKFKQAGFTNFQNGECRVSVNGVICLINKKGEIVFTPKLAKNMDDFEYGLSLAYTKPNRTGFGYFNRSNQWVIEPVYTSASVFKGGYATVKLNDKEGVIDTTGKEVIPVIYDNIYANAAEDGYFAAEKSDAVFYFNKDGKPFTAEIIKYLYPSNGHSLLPFQSTDGKFGYMTLDGSVFIAPVYTKASSFSEGKAWVY